MRKLLAGLVLTGAVVAVGGSASAQSIKLMTGPQGGSWYPLGGAIKNIVENNVDGSSVQVLPGAGIANVKAVEAGKADIGFANSVSTVDAIEGKPPFEEQADNVCNLATLYPQYFQVVALADAGIETPEDFKGKALSTQPKGNTGEQITRHLLEAAGLSYDDMSQVSFGSYTDSVNLLKDGNAQIFTLGTTVPAGAIMDLASARDIKLVPISDEILAKMKEINPGYTSITIKGGTYPGQDEPVQTIGYATHLVARCDLDENFVYNALKAIHGNLDNLVAIAKAMEGLTPEQMAQDIGVPMHPGAEKFYQEQGVI